MTELHIDFETRSELDLRKVGLHRYARHASTEVWCMGWALDEHEPSLLPVYKSHLASNKNHPWSQHVKSGSTVIAHNAPFELEIWNQIMVPRYGWPALKPEQTFCTMAQCFAMGLPGALEDAALALGMDMLKDGEGRALMLKYARPWRDEPTVQWMDECPSFTLGGKTYTGAEGLLRLYDYCKQDVRVERGLGKRLMPLSARERKVWLLDYKINQRGVQLDIPSVKAAIVLAETIKAQAGAQMVEITDGAVEGVTALPSLKTWIDAQGVTLDGGLAKQDVVDLLEDDALPEPVRKALILRQEVGKASAAKFDVMIARAGDDGRLRQMYQYHGAGSGRWAGRAVQTHNLIRDMPKAAAVETILQLVREGRHGTIDAIFGPPLTMVARCMRSFFIAPPGRKLISGDWANIEGRGGAWFAGEQWKLDAFRAADNGTGPGVYELIYSNMFGVPVESVKNPSEERQVGKVSDLSFLYQGGVGSGKMMGKTYGVKAPDEKWEQWKMAWRTAHPAIAGVLTYGRDEDGTTFAYHKGGIWRAVEKAAIAAVNNPGEAYECGYPGRTAKFKMVGSFLWCLLPSGRAICYPYPKLLAGSRGPMLTYMCVPSQDDKRKGAIIDDPSNASNWARVGTYGGALFNRIVQGFSRDFLADGMIVLDEAGADIVLHTHDDINAEVDDAKAEGACGAMKRIMMTPPAWAPGFPLIAKPTVMQRYGK